MPLSEHEKQVLADLESQLQDTELAGASFPAMSAEPAPEAPRDKGNFSARVIAFMVVAVLIGAVALIAGVAQGYTVWGILTGILGFLIMLIGVTLPWSPWVKRKRRDNVQAAAPKPARGKKRFMDRQQERWDRRREEP